MLNLGFIPAQEKILNYFFNGLRFGRQTRLFKITLYGLVLLKLFYYAIYYNLYFGEHSIVYSQPAFIHGFRDLAFVLYSNGSTSLPAVFIAFAAVGSLCALVFKRHTFLPDVLTWFCLVNLHNKVYTTLTGGDFLMNQFLLIGCFLSFRDFSSGFFSDLRRLVHNLACMALYLQICFIYLFSGLAKTGDAHWLDGSAMAEVAQVDYFSLYSAFKSSSWSPLFHVMTWLVLGYQLLFPLLMWFQGIKKPLLIIGVLMHIYIGVVLGLPQFALIMIAAYVFLWPVNRQNGLK